MALRESACEIKVELCTELRFVKRRNLNTSDCSGHDKCKGMLLEVQINPATERASELRGARAGLDGWICEKCRSHLGNVDHKRRFVTKLMRKGLPRTEQEKEKQSGIATRDNVFASG
mmetsp:Transcript_21539/g.40220  ORF Transcript_21539/g.40220 Transcript_21539/m.40220 type:complete len:117 (+) Transcript_21539:164-514(+)